MMDLIGSDNLMLSEKLRNDDPEQFYTLVKMHLSFVLDLNMDESDANTEKKIRTIKWNLPFSKKNKPFTKNYSDGSHLTVDFMEQIRQLIKFLSIEDNISQEGIFRRSGKVTRQQELKTLISQGVAINLSDGHFSVHDCATVLKNILSELPESVLTDAHFPAYCQIAELCNVKGLNNEDRLLESLQLLILLLPSENRIFFQDIIALLHLAASHEDKNRMSADNLATLFTPHLLCPRKLSPEALHMNSQVMSRVVAFMIKKGTQLFQIPVTLATDLQAYWNKKERRKLSPLKQVNESVCDGTAANTVFTFVDRERTAQENGANPTETALAQLYAYIQALPESSKKRKLIKQFNKENGHGTPLRALGGKKRTRSRSIGDSIKKHLPAFTKTPKRPAQPIKYEDEIYNSPVPQKSRDIRSVVEKETHDKIKENIPVLKQHVATDLVSLNIEQKNENLMLDEVSTIRSNHRLPPKCLNYDICNGINSREEVYMNLYSTGNEGAAAPKNIMNEDCVTKKNSSSVTSISPKLSCTEKDEAVFHEVVIEHEEKRHNWPVSSTIKSQDGGKIKPESIQKDNIQRPEPYVSSSNVAINIGSEPLSISYKTPCKPASLRHIDSEGFVEPSVLDNPMKTPSRKIIMNNNMTRFTNNDLFISSPNTTNRIAIRYCSKTHLLMTSTPAQGNGCIVTPIVDKNNSMSPITRSTQRMPKAMQETMMTPRSRKPVISLSGTDLCNLANMDSISDYQEDNVHEIKTNKEADFGKRLLLEDASEMNNSDSLSSTFRDYLFSRSVLTTSPVDLSFSSRTDDFLSLSENNSSIENEDFKSLTESVLNEEALSESLLYCLDGNQPRSSDSFRVTDKDPNASYDGSSCTKYPNKSEVNHMYETAL